MGYSGIAIPIPAGSGGFNPNDNIDQVPVTDLIRAKNITVEGNAWRKSPGVSQLFTTVSGTPELVASYDWWPSATVQRLITVWSDGKIYKETAGTTDAVLLTTLANPDTMGVFVAGGLESAGSNRKLFYISASNPVKVLSGDGVVMTSIATPPADWTGANQPTGGGYHEGRLVGFGNSNYPHGVYFSTDTSHEDFTGTGSALVKVYPGEGERIVAGISLQRYRFYIWKYPRGLYYIDTTNGLANAQIIKVRDDIGAAGPGCVVRAGADVPFVTADGSVHSLLAQEVQDVSTDIKDSDITAMFNLQSWMKDQVTMSRLDRTRMIYYAQKKQTWISFTSKSGSRCDRLLIGDTSRQTPRMFWDDRAAAYDGLSMRRDDDGIEKPVGGMAGKVFRFDRVSRNFDNSAYASEGQIPDTDFGWYNQELACVDKAFDYLEATVTPTGNYTLSIDVIIDGRLTQTVTMNLGSSGGALGSFILGTDRLSGRSIIKHKVKIAGKGRYLGLRFYGNGYNQDFSISQFVVWCRPLGPGGVK